MGVGGRFRAAGGYEPLEPYNADGDRLLAGYRVEGLLARDAWRRPTYDASMSDGRRVALKLLNVRSRDSRRSMKRFERRLRLRASIRHPHLLPILDWGRLGDRYYLAMAFCQAPTLAALLRTAPPGPKGAVRLLGQLADALETAHEAGLMHRDLAPERVLVEPRDGGHVWLGDFGVADPEWASGLLDPTGSMPYLSPERLRDEPLTPESNVYSLACILVECLTGSPPYTSEHAGTVAYAHVAEPPPRLSDDHPGLPRSIDDVVAAAMAKDPGERLASARQLATAAAVSLGAHVSPPLDSASPQPALAGPAVTGPSVQERLPRESVFRAQGPRRALGRHALPLALAATVAFSGALGFVLGRSGDGATEPASNRPVAEQLERSASVRATDASLERLDARRAVARRRLAAAPTPRVQAREAARLATAHQLARRMLARRSGLDAQLASALNQAERAYGRLAAAARRADRRGYAAARRGVGRSEGELERAIARLNRGRR